MDPSYAINIAKPTTTIPVNSAFEISGDVSWPSYKPDADQVEVLVKDPSNFNLPVFKAANTMGTISNNSAPFSTGKNVVVTHSGNYVIIINVYRNGTLLNSKSITVTAP